MATSYANAGGTGNRTATITVVAAGWSNASPNTLVNGNLTETVGYFNGLSSLEFQWTTPKIIDEVKFYQQNTVAHGTWKWQGSNDGTLWTDVGGSFTLGGVATQTITTLAGNTQGYYRWRIVLVSGASSNSPYVYEFEFKIDDAATTTAPDVSGLTEAAATTALTTAGLVKGAVYTRYHATIAAGLVVSQNPASGTTLPTGAAVGLVLSGGSTMIGLIAQTAFTSGMVETAPIDTTGADLLVVVWTGWINEPDIVDSKGNIWSDIPRRNNGNNLVHMKYVTGPVVGSGHTFHLKHQASTNAIVLAFINVKSYQSETGGTSSNVNTLTLPSITPAVDGSLILTVFMQDFDPGNVSVSPAEYASVLQQSMGWDKLGVAYIVQGTAAASVVTWSWANNSFGQVGQVAVFQPGTPTAAGRISQIPIEVLQQSDPPVARLSHIAIEAGVKTLVNPVVSLSQVNVEVGVYPSSTLPAKLSQVSVEVAVKVTGGETSDLWID